MVAALAAEFGDAWEFGLQESGMHLLARLPPGSDDTALAAKAAAAGLGPVALSPWAIRARCSPGLIIGFANSPAVRSRRDVALLGRALYTGQSERPQGRLQGV
jgi:GntR family transcriptional regulator/MocR family aminotransferase